MKSVIIGGSSGMGLSIAKMLCSMDHQVVIGSRSKEKLDKAKLATQGRAETLLLDVTKEEDIARFFESIGPFDHLVTSAADFAVGPFLKMPTERAKHFFDSKFWGQYLAAKYAAPYIQKEGSITFFGGVAAQKPFLNFAAGCAINAAIEGLTRALALELAPLRVNAICPGTIITPVWDSLGEKERRAEFEKTAQKLPVKRVGKPEDIAQAARYLITCGYATGSIVYVDGGDRIA
jgi:NAD(P)-dependent dehydrogenase (short-subunit alcohol dehydrogenase family)